jgi:sugar (pentulose or hexulose) kinase
VGIDSWNIDFGLVDEQGRLLGNPISYRDPGATWASEEISRRISSFDLYQETGLPVSPITGLARLVQMGKEGHTRHLELARHYLPIADLIRFFLTGDASVEETIAWGTQLLDIGRRSWSIRLIELFDLPQRIFPELVPPGRIAGTLREEVAFLTGLNICPIATVAEHDTASAVFAAHLLDPEAAVLSVGTWSIMGALLEQPLSSQKAQKYGFMNEIASGAFLLGKNLMGFYLLEEFIKRWRAKGMECGYATVMRLARAAPAGGMQLDPNDPLFFSPPNPWAAFQEYCRKTSQKPIDDIGTTARALFDGLANSYAQALAELNELLGKDFRRIVMVGGGVRNGFLCHLVAHACGVELTTGPAEAASVGNLCVQALALERFRVEDLGPVIRQSFPVGTVSHSQSNGGEKP